MFKTLRNALKIEDIRKKLIFTFLMLGVVRFGSQLQFCQDCSYLFYPVGSVGLVRYS